MTSPIAKDSQTSSASDPVQEADKYLYKYENGMTVFDRFRDCPAPGGSRLFKKIKNSYTVMCDD